MGWLRVGGLSTIAVDSNPVERAWQANGATSGALRLRIALRAARQRYNLRAIHLLAHQKVTFATALCTNRATPPRDGVGGSAQAEGDDDVHDHELTKRTQRRRGRGAAVGASRRF